VRTIAIIGSTGSIGTQTLDVVRANADIRIGALAAGNNIELLEKQVREFKPALVSVQSKDKADALRIALSDFNCKIVYGMDGLIAVATYEPAELVVTAIVGMIGIRPTIEAIKAGKDIALANKETLVTAGHLIMKLAEEYHVRILPVDSEHSAIFQCLHGERENKIAKLLITASGGPFLGTDDLTACLLQLQNLRHGCVYIRCLCICHRLNRNRIAATDHDTANIYHSRRISVWKSFFRSVSHNHNPFSNLLEKCILNIIKEYYNHQYHK
jgi:1-deoxy-D-xylulose 5-phosphate reductoisomerase